MGDFPPQWEWVRDLTPGGQAYTYQVRRSDASDAKLYVLKRLKNPKREDNFEREIRACTALDHPNLLPVVDHGRTPKGALFLITVYCSGGSLEEKLPRFESPLDGLRLFQQIVSGVEYAHARSVFHLDLKPENIFLKDGRPVVGDFGICFIEEDEVTLTKEGVRGSRYYCAPELRNPKISGSPRLAVADIYSLGKVLYWLYTREVYDGHEDDYANDPARRLASLFPSYPEFAFIDELIEALVRRNPEERVASTKKVASWVQSVIERIDAGGRVLDLTKPIRCLFCGNGTYLALATLPPIERRLAPLDPGILPSYRPDIWAAMRDGSSAQGFPAHRGGAHSIPPIVLVCQYCGNVQQFRLDIAPEAMKNWKP